MRKRTVEIENLEEFNRVGLDLRNHCLQKIDFSTADIAWSDYILEGAVFLGCTLKAEERDVINHRGGIIFPRVENLPYEMYRNTLYTWQELYASSDQAEGITYDENIYNHFYENRYNISVTEALFQRLHDHAIDDALYELLGSNDDGTFQKKCIGVMGGHSKLRNDTDYKQVVRLSHALAQEGFFICSGGGPGIMEAANLGAYLKSYSSTDVETALDIMDSEKKYSDPGYMDDAMQVLEKFPDGTKNLAIPTWFYGHEPSNVFASHIAKYFSNSIREDILLAVSIHGIVFAPGSAGTHQEIFMDAAQNHYVTFSYRSPMVFLNEEHYVEKTGIFPLLKHLAGDKEYGKKIMVSDSITEIVQFIVDNPPYNNPT